MKYFVLLIGILIQREVLSLIEASQIYFHNTNFSGRNKSNSLNDILLKKKNILNVVKRNNVQMDKYQEVTSSCSPGDIQLSDDDISKLKIFPNKKCSTRTTCASTIGMLPYYENVECYYAPRKIICKLGNFNFVINNGDHNMTRDIVEKFITMAYERYGEGDNCFDVAVDEVDTTPCACYSTQIITEPPQTSESNEVPVIVECNLVSNEKLKMCNPNYEPTEKIYQCKAKTMGLKKRNLLNVLINDYKGKVSLVKDVIRHITRKKRECINSPKKSYFSSNKPLKRHLNLKSKFDQEIIPEEDDISNVYYSTKMPCVRNYTDLCTLTYGRNKLWCPSFQTFAVFCSTMMASSHLNSSNPCVVSENRAGKINPANSGSCTNSFLVSAEEVITEPTRLFGRNIKLPNRWKRYKYWRRRRKLQPWKFGINGRIKSHINGRSVNIKKDSKLSLDSNFALEPQKLISFNLNTSVPGLATTCIVPGNRRDSNQSQFPSTCLLCNNSSQWCTSIVTVPCNVSALVTTLPNTKIDCKNSPDAVPENTNLTQLNEHSRQNYAELRQTDSQQPQILNEDQFFLNPQVKYNQMDVSNVIEPRNFVSRTVMGKKLRSSLGYHSGLPHRKSDPYNWPDHFKMQYRPKRKILLKKLSRFRRGPLIRWKNNRKNSQMYNELIHE